MSATATQGLRWLRHLTLHDAPPPPSSATVHGLRLLGYLRVFAPLAQALTLFVVTEHFSVRVPLPGIVTLIGLQVLIAIATQLRLRTRPEVTEFELFLQAQFDILVYSAVLYFTGGTENPFAPLFVLPMMIVASAMRPRWVWLMAASTIVAYVLLRNHHVDLGHPEGHTHVYKLHEDGMVVNYLITAGLLAFFCNRMHASLRRNERMLADARDAQMRNESVVAIGALAAGYAHELSSPLSTMAVATAELKHQCAPDSPMQRDLQLISDQIAECKRIVSNLASAGGERRAESAGAVRVDRFLDLAIGRARALLPGMSITATIDGPSPPPMIVGEETLGQAIMNLIQNAAQASPDWVRVTATWSPDELCVEVRDRGPGIAPELLERLGRRILSTKGDNGTGLGLLLSATTLERLGGRLEAANPPEGGARVAIRVPMRSIVV